MTIPIPETSRLLLEADLKPAQGTRFQPTGFPDVGAARYATPDGVDMLLVESAQSMANRLEAVCWDPAKDALNADLEGMPFVEVRRGDRRLTNTLLEAHRLNSVYVEKSDGWDEIKGLLAQDDGPFDRVRLAKGLMLLDPCCLVHGVFLESISGTLRVPRALSAFVEARDVEVVSSGGVKNDRVAAGTEQGSGAAEGYGNVPFHREEYTARQITAYFNVDLAQLRSYRLGDEATTFLYALSLWKVRTLLEGDMRFRTACDLEVSETRVTRPSGYTLPTLDALKKQLASTISTLRTKKVFGPVKVVQYGGSARKGKKKTG